MHPDAPRQGRTQTNSHTSRGSYGCSFASSLDVERPGAYTHAMIDAGIGIIFQDHHMLAVNKPAGLVIHPTYMHANGTMWDELLEYLARQGGDDWQPAEM